MSDNEKKISRRAFLRAGTAAAALGVIGAAQMPGQAAAAATENMTFQASPTGQWSKLHPRHDYGSALVRFVENDDRWLGTSELLSPPQNTSEADMGFNQANRGLLGELPQKGVRNFIPKHPFGGAISFARTLIAPETVVDGEPSPEKFSIPDPEQMSQHIKDAAYFLRADEVGIGKMPPYAYYSHKVKQGADWTKPLEENIYEFTERLPYVIVVMVDQHLETMLASTGYDGISGSQSMRSYHATGNIAVILAKYIRTLGYRARAHHSANYGAPLPPLMIAAGLGELSRTGDCVIHPRLGFRHKLAAVTTDLPLAPDKPIDFGLIDFCRVCKKCADNCPNQSISFDREPVEYNGYLRWNSDFKKCTIFRTTNEEGSSCGRCMKVCPWNSKEDSWFHKAGTWIGSRGEASANLLKSIDDMFGYGTEEIPKYKWWLEWPDNYKVESAATASGGSIYNK
ncbi:MAG: reductive dehalogenase [Gracilibacteraceae bacterium]|jgi:reductive dehalogenase|nr:reductive dehalogenase [Gracilibacteraceae bacterium]